MALIEFSIDTADKSKATITVDGKTYKNVAGLYVYGLNDPEYTQLEITQYETVGEGDGAMHKMTRLVASQNENFVEAKCDDEEEKKKTRASIADFIESLSS